jgi:sulfatase maturation enzyme AslB (radical SAM superfamily)
VVTSAFRAIPGEWKSRKKLNIVVSIDGLQPEHDARRKPATYERILKNIEQARITVHCTITSQIAGRPGYLDEFLSFWSAQQQVSRIWFSFFTPQRGAYVIETLSAAQRAQTIAELHELRRKYPKLEMPETLLRELELPPSSPADCIFARTTATVSADLKTRITPCQFGGDPDCAQCGCIASMGLAAVGHHRVAGPLTAGHLFKASDRVGKALRRVRSRLSSRPGRHASVSPFNILGS